MKTFVCKVCGYISFENAPDRCPVCGAGSGSFEDKADAIKSPADPANLTEGDKKHIPVLKVVKECGLIPGGSCIDLHVKVGEIVHVMEEKHYITYIDFYLDRKFISRIHLSPGNLHPGVILHLSAVSGTVTAVEKCNIHGAWMSEADL